LDVKPQNVLIKYLPNGKYQVKIIDMGLSIYVNPNIKYYYEQITQDDKTVLSPTIIPDNILIRNFYRESVSIHYRPHEVYNLGIVSDRSDVWSLGISFLELLSGMDIVIFMGTAEQQILSTIELMKDDSQRKTFINNCLKKNKEGRINQEVYDMIDLMLKPNFKERISTEDLLTKYLNKQISPDISQDIISRNTASQKVEDNEIITNNCYFPNFHTLNGIRIIILFSMELNLLIETVFLGIDLFYRTLKRFKAEHNRDNVHLLAFICIFIATKITEDIKKIISVNYLSKLTDNKYDVKQLITMESSIVLRHGGKLYLRNNFHKCKCRHDIINALNEMCNIFVYPYNPEFVSKCRNNSGNYGENNTPVCQKPFVVLDSNLDKEIEMYPITIREIIADNFFVKGEIFIDEKQCGELFNALQRK